MSDNSASSRQTKKPLKAVILAAGKGKRLQSEQAHIPKHMLKAAGNPLLYYVLKSVDFIEDKFHGYAICLCGSEKTVDKGSRCNRIIDRYN